MSAKLIYVTAPTREEAEKIAETVVTEKLAACANILDGVTSIFHWEGKLCRENEVVLILKTSAERVEALSGQIKQLHSYDCPCIVALPIESGNPDFLNWVEESSRERGRARGGRPGWMAMRTSPKALSIQQGVD